ncbi:MAG: hypothetical protein LBS97_02890 [Treponema sp.]|jgi:hypothetical protein|nr:hypothetical protein [Treponema sp.]
MNLLEWSYIGTILSGFAGFIGLYIAFFQLRGLKKSLEQANIMAMFQVEFELSRRKERVASIRRQVMEKTYQEQAGLMVLDGFVKEALEDYYNIFDRLCFFILKPYFNEEDFRLEFRDMLFQTIESDESGFGVGSPYQNMVKLYRRWKDK